MDGCLVVFKPRGLTSHDVVDLVRKAYKVRAGHAGTLDPMAQGVLLVFLERGLKILQFIPPSVLDKTYLLRITLGSSTDSYDAMGKITATYPGSLDLPKDRILATLRQFVGTIDQTPPAFSAVKVNGKRAYDLARSGKTPELASRKIHVVSIRLVKDYVSDGTRHLVLRLHCSRGTYVRSIAHEFGAQLGCGGHLSYLLRERVGVWSHQQAFPVWKIERNLPFETTHSFMPIQDVLPFSRLVIEKNIEGKVKSGAPLEVGDIQSISKLPAIPDGEELFQVFSTNGNLLALYGHQAKGAVRNTNHLVPVRVLI